MALSGFAFSGRESQCRPTQFSGHVDLMARPRAASKQRIAAWNCAANGHVAEEFFASREIAAGEYCLVSIRRFGQRVEEVIHPAVRCPFGETNRRETESGRSAHGGNVAETARESDPANVRGFVGFFAKVSSFRKNVGRKKQIVSAAARAINGAIVANPGNNGRTRRDFDELFQAFGEGSFVSQTGRGELMPFGNCSNSSSEYPRSATPPQNGSQNVQALDKRIGPKEVKSGSPLQPPTG